MTTAAKDRKVLEYLKKIIVRIFPDIVYDKDTARRAISELNKKLRDERENSNKWRNRALETEKCLMELNRYKENLAREYDRKGHTNLFLKL